MSCAPCQPCQPACFDQPENFGLLFPSLVGPMGPPGGPGTYVNSLTELRALDATIWPNGYQVYVAGYADVHDGGGGYFTYVSAATDADNNGTIIAPLNGIGRWFRVYSGPLDVRWLGATGGNVVDDTAALQAALDLAATGDALSTTQGVKVYIPTGVYRFTALTALPGLIITGDGPNLSILRKTTTTGYGILFDSTGLTPGAVQDSISVLDLSIVQVGIATNGGGIYVNGVTSAAQAIIENVRIEDCYRGFVSSNTLGSFLKNVKVFSSVVDGFYFIDGFKRQVCLDCYAEDCGTSGVGSGFSMSGGAYSNFYSCASNDNDDNGFYVINTNYCGWYGCGQEGNVVGIYMTTSVGNVIDNLFTYAKVNASSAILLDGSNSNEIRNLASNHQNAAYGTYLIEIQNGSVDNTLSVGYLSNIWPSGLTNTLAAFNEIRNAGIVTYNADMVFTSASLKATNLPTSPGVTDEIWVNSGVLEISP